MSLGKISRSEALRTGGWFFLLNAGFALLIAARYMKHFTGIEGITAYAYIVIATLSHFVALVFIPYVLFYVPVALTIPRKVVLSCWSGLIATLTLGLLALDTFVFDLYRFHINRFTLELLFGGAGTDIFQFHVEDYLLVFSVLAAVLVGEWFLFRWLLQSKWRQSLRVGRWAIPAVALMMLGGHAIHAWAAATCYRPITKASRYYPLYFPTTANHFFVRMGWASPEQNQVNLGAVGDDEAKDLRYPLAPIDADTASHPNILLILLDSWNYRAMDSAVTPNIARFAAKAQLFRNHYSGSNGTRTGVFSLFYSLPGTYWYDILAAKTRPVFIDQLLARSYRFGVYTSASLISPPFDQTVFAGVQGIPLRVPGDQAPDRDIQITADWLAFTRQFDDSSEARPFFGFLFYDAMHAISHPKDFKGPFQPAWEHAKYERLSNNTDPLLFWNLYRNIAYFEDSLVGMVLNDLQQRGLLESTIVIITGDHGQEFNENGKGYWGHNGNYSQAQVGVPLVVYWPGITPAVYDHWTSHYDLVPTVMPQAFGCRNEIRDYSIGRNLLDTTPRQWLLVGSEDNFGVIESDRITSINFDRTFDITDRNLNEIDGAKINAPLIDEILRTINVYYAK